MGRLLTREWFINFCKVRIKVRDYGLGQANAPADYRQRHYGGGMPSTCRRIQLCFSEFIPSSTTLFHVQMCLTYGRSFECQHTSICLSPRDRVKAKFHSASWFEADSNLSATSFEPASAMEFGFQAAVHRRQLCGVWDTPHWGYITWVSIRIRKSPNIKHWPGCLTNVIGEY